MLRLAHTVDDSGLLLEAHLTLGFTLYHMGELARSREHWDQGSALYDRAQHHALTFAYNGFDPGVACLDAAGLTLFSDD